MSDTKISEAAVKAARLKFGTMEPNHFGHERMKDAIEAALAHILGGAQPVEFDYPEFHSQGMGCGLEDRNITDRYEAMRYGFDEALDQMATILDSIGPLYTHPQPAELADASVVEQIAQQWDGCQYDAPGEMVDIGAAIRRAGERLSAEQAEQGVDAHTLWAMAQLAPGEGIEDGVRRIEKALAATGKQQVGEVQGDGRAQFEAWMTNTAKIIVGSSDPYPAGLERDYWRVWQAALAARQPVVQEPVGQPEPFGWWLERPDGEGVLSLEPLPGVLEAYDGVEGYRATPVFTYTQLPPAQGIDLGQEQDAARWRAIAPLLSVEWDEDEQLERWTWIDFKGDAPAIPSPTREDYASVDAAVDALIRQRDAAPGVLS